jgi:NAD-dependent SIR2 family protein deacetylase
MSENTKTALTLKTVSEKEAMLKKVKAELKAAQDNAKWEADTKAVNPQFVLGSVRKATPADEAELGHCHGVVCSIVCLTCGETRTVNKQDAKQCQFCKACKKGADKDRAKAKRADKRLAGKSVEDLQAEIAEAEAALAALATKAA